MAEDTQGCPSRLSCRDQQDESYEPRPITSHWRDLEEDVNQPLELRADESAASVSAARCGMPPGTNPAISNDQRFGWAPCAPDERPAGAIGGRPDPGRSNRVASVR